MATKKRVFLGAYLNSINAQNLNCRALAQHIDSKKFECGAMEIETDELPSLSSSVKIFKAHWPHRLSMYNSYLRGILWSDIVYLPKTEASRWCRFLCWLFKKPSFSTIESVDEGTNWEKQLNNFGHKTAYLNHYMGFNMLFAISKYIAYKNTELHGLNFNGILPLGVDLPSFDSNIKKELQSVIIIGNNLYYKGWNMYLQLATAFPTINFHVVGSGMGLINPKEESQHLNNVICHGQLTHQELNNILKTVDLHVLPSRSEGFPKVVLECAAAGVPSLLFSDYGANEWMEGGFVVDKNEEMNYIISLLLQEPERLRKASSQSILLAEKYAWKYVVKRWEEVLSSLS
tara:strand:+ start:2270 stop:3304 length:1035 start_codon:yes stop_codon:yes gene_type:complete